MNIFEQSEKIILHFAFIILHFAFLPSLMMEESHSCKRHNHAVLVAGFDDGVIADGSAGLGNVGNAALLCALDAVREGEECIRTECNTGDGVEVCADLLCGEGIGLLGEVLLPDTVCANVFFVLVDVAVNDVVAVCALEVIAEGKVQNLVVLTEKPGVSLGACKSCAVDSRLLTCANADSLTVKGKANGV